VKERRVGQRGELPREVAVEAPGLLQDRESMNFMAWFEGRASDGKLGKKGGRIMDCLTGLFSAFQLSTR